eukprot:gb/GECH01003355.1/.p1 GENE.gb/GECH01003355.1/~~gb/GECH01003355.1/.p1  ORF type:complete len:814 (+),score=180.79 gb/GECH01003355.1/:1-2442(+)
MLTSQTTFVNGRLYILGTKGLVSIEPTSHSTGEKINENIETFDMRDPKLITEMKFDTNDHLALTSNIGQDVVHHCVLQCDSRFERAKLIFIPETASSSGFADIRLVNFPQTKFDKMLFINNNQILFVSKDSISIQKINQAHFEPQSSFEQIEQWGITPESSFATAPMNSMTSLLYCYPGSKPGSVVRFTKSGHIELLTPQGSHKIPPSTQLTACCVSEDDRYLFMSGGFSNSNLFTDIWMFGLESRIWHYIGSLNTLVGSLHFMRSPASNVFWLVVVPFDYLKKKAKILQLSLPDLQSNKFRQMSILESPHSDLDEHRSKNESETQIREKTQVNDEKHRNMNRSPSPRESRENQRTSFDNFMRNKNISQSSDSSVYSSLPKSSADSRHYLEHSPNQITQSSDHSSEYNTPRHENNKISSASYSSSSSSLTIPQNYRGGSTLNDDRSNYAAMANLDRPEIKSENGKDIEAINPMEESSGSVSSINQDYFNNDSSQPGTSSSEHIVEEERKIESSLHKMEEYTSQVQNQLTAIDKRMEQLITLSQAERLKDSSQETNQRNLDQILALIKTELTTMKSQQENLVNEIKEPLEPFFNKLKETPTYKDLQQTTEEGVNHLEGTLKDLFDSLSQKQETALQSVSNSVRKEMQNYQRENYELRKEVEVRDAEIRKLEKNLEREKNNSTLIQRMEESENHLKQQLSEAKATEGGALLLTEKLFNAENKRQELEIQNGNIENQLQKLNQDYENSLRENEKMRVEISRLDAIAKDQQLTIRQLEQRQQHQMQQHPSNYNNHGNQPYSSNPFGGSRSSTPHPFN